MRQENIADAGKNKCSGLVMSGEKLKAFYEKRVEGEEGKVGLHPKLRRLCRVSQARDGLIPKRVVAHEHVQDAQRKNGRAHHNMSHEQEQKFVAEKEGNRIKQVSPVGHKSSEDRDKKKAACAAIDFDGGRQAPPWIFLFGCTRFWLHCFFREHVLDHRIGNVVPAGGVDEHLRIHHMGIAFEF